MKKFVCLSALVGLSSMSFGFINLNLNNPYQSGSVPNTGSIFVTFSGVADVLVPTFDVTSFVIENPGNGSQFLNVVVDPGFNAYVTGSNAGVDYTGDFFTVEIQSTDATGNYWLNSAGLSGLSEFTVTGFVPGLPDASDNEFFGVTVVPEPATLAALGIGAAALLRRRRQNKA